MNPKIFPLLAETGSEFFSFSGFQTGFRDAWNFIFPNVFMLLMCILVARYVGKLELRWLNIQRGKLQEWLRAFSKFLEDSGLGSKFLPAIALLAIFIAGLDIFQTVRLAVSNLLPPEIIFNPSDWYEQHASGELLLRLIVVDESISEPGEVYDRIYRWDEKMRREYSSTSTSNIDRWEDTGSTWFQWADNIKLLGAIACVSCLCGLFNRRWKSVGRLVLVLLVLTTSYVYCLAKELYAQEQQYFAVLDSLEEHSAQSVGDNWNQQLLKRWKDLSLQGDWLTQDSTITYSSWWELRWFDIDFFKRTSTLLGGYSAETNRFSLISKEYLERLKASELAEPSQNIRSNNIPNGRTK